MKKHLASAMSNADIIKSVKLFYELYKHFPFKSDFRSLNNLPSRNCLVARFGSIIRLAKLCGIKPNTRGCPSGEHSPTWKGGRIKNPQGYIRVWVKRPSGEYRTTNNRRKPGNYILEHRLAMQKHLGRILNRTEIIHHKNGIKDDNRIENLEVVTLSTHRGKVCCPKCEFSFKVQ